MPALTNPLNTAEVDLAYSTNSGGAWTDFGSEILDFQPDAWVRKQLDRLLINGTRVQKYLARINYGSAKVIAEWSSATWVIVLGWFTNKTLVWLRTSPEDTGGTNDSNIIFKGSAYGSILSVQPYSTPGDDEIMRFEFVLAVDDVASTAGA